MRSSILFPFFFISVLVGQPSFTAADIATSADGARSVFVADMDNDGDMDIVSASYTDNTIAWYENDGAANPSWTAADITTSADAAYSVFVADMDNDGDMDIVSASQERSNAIDWYENDGAVNPTWTAANIATSADGARSVFVADMDNDGDMDIVSASENDDKIAWYENDGAANPAWTAANIATNVDGASSVFAADMDNDGDMDIVSASLHDNTIAWYENDGAANPTFTAADIASTVDGSFESVFAADMDNDGDMDIVSASQDDDAITWYENDGAADPAFTAADIATSADGAQSVFAADMDNDGDMDIVSASLYDDTIAWYENDGAANPSWTAADIATSADGARSVFAADMDNDGDMDIVSASADDDAIAWYENTTATPGTPTFTQFHIESNATNANVVYAADINSDGKIEVLWGQDHTAGANDKIRWIEHNGADNLGWTNFHTITSNANGVRSIYTIDLDRDGDLDVLSASLDDNTVAWFENDGASSPSFTRRNISTSVDNAESAYAIDIDHDGDIDVVTAGRSSGVDLYKNNGSQSFTVQSIDTDYANSIYAVDVDADGDNDIIAANSNDNKVVWYENNYPTNLFSGRVITSSASGVQDIFAIDLDRDGDIDIISAYEGLNWYENDGASDPSFTDRTIYTASSNDATGTVSVFATDMDKDGDVDLLTASNSRDHILLHENNGSQSFSRHVIESSSDGPRSVYAIDVDRDGDMDIVKASANDNKVSWFESSFDETAPTVSSVSLDADNTTIAVTMSEAVYNTNGGSGALEASDFVLSISGGAATLSSATPTSISISGNVYTLGIGLSGTPNGSETLTVNPVDDSIYDAAGNEASTSQSNNTATLNQRFILQAASKEQGPTKGIHNSLVKVDDDTYALAYEGSGNDGKIKTFTIPADGSTITKVATLVHDTDNGEYNSLVKVDDDTYVLAYQGSGDDGFITTFTIPADGSTITEVATLEHDTDYARNNSLVQVDNDTYALAYAGTDDDGFITTFTIPADGSSITKVATLEYDTGNGRGNSLVKMDDNTYALAYRGPDDDGFITTFTIPADGSTITKVATLEHDGVKGKSNSLVQVDNDTYALAYQGSDDDGFITTFTIPADGSTITEVATLEHDTNKDGYNSLVKLNSKTYALAYSGTNDDGYFTLFEISANGATITKVASLEYDTDNGQYNSLEIVDANTAALAYTGKDSDGYIKTFTLVSNDDQAPTILSVSLASDNSTLAVTFSEAVFNTDGGSGTLEANDFAFSISGGTASLSSATPSSISASGNIYTLGIGLSGTPNGSETLTVKPVDNGIYDAAGNEASTTQSNNTATLKDQAAPATPSGLVATPGNSKVVLSWTANSESDLASYKIYRGTSANPTTVLVTMSGSTKLTNTGRTNGTTYYYRISAVDDAGNESSKTSDVITMPHNTDNSYSLSFDGSDDVVTVSSTSVFTGIGTGNFSISLWAKFDADDTWEGLISKGYYESGVNNALVIRREEDGNKIQVSASDGTSGTDIITGSTAITNSTGWFHAVLTRSSNSFTLYINGSSDGTGTYSGSLFDNSEPIEFGQGNGTNNSERLDGYLDEIVFWNKALTSAEASALYNSGAGLSAASNSGNYASSSNLKGYWKFSENSGTTAYDLSGYGHHGTISGAAYNTATFTADETAPTISSVSLDADNLSIAVTMSEAVYNTNGGSGALEVSDFALSISGGTATLSSATPTSISISGNVYTLGIGLSGIANGSETLTVTPVDDGIYDAAGNEASTSQSNNTASLNAIGESLSFDGVDDQVIAQSIIFENDDNLTISMWVKPESFSSNSTNTFLVQGYCSSGDTRIYLANENGSLAFGLTTDNGWHEWDFSYDMNSLLNSWNYLTFTYGSNLKKIFINGELQGTNNGNSGNMLSCNNGNLIFGSNISARYYHGKMDEVAIWNDDLTSAEITAIYNSGVALDAKSNSGNYTSSADIKGYWKMEEGTGTTLTDLSGYGNNGAISGATWATGKKSSSYTNTAKDITGPTVTFAPANGASGVAVDRNITITFNEAARKIDDSAITDANVDALITLKSTNASGDDIAFDATVNDGKTVITINPSSDFSSEQIVYVAIGATVEDAIGNAITASSVTFTILDVNATSVTFSPADGAKDISVSSNVTITFGEAVRKIDDSAITDTNVDALITLKSTNASGDDIGFDATINSGKTVITVNPTNDFSSEQVVYTAIGATVEDDANNAISATSITFTTADVTAPATPMDLVATVGNGKVVLVWNANTESDLASYKVYGGTSASPTTVLATVTSGQTYTHSSLTNGTKYYYSISAVDKGGNESDKTSDITAVPTPQKYAVRKDGSGDYTTIQAGITAALTGDTILVSEGTYEEHIDFGGKNIVVTSNYITTNDTLTISNTIIKGTTNNAVVIFSTGNSTSGTLNGFTVTNGKGIVWPSSAFDRAGGGIYVGQRMSPTISNCFIRGNTCADNCAGAGIMVYSGSPTIENCIIENNTTEKGQGGGIYIESGSSTNVKISRTLIRNNKADFEGGGIFSNNKFELINSYVINNQSSKGKELFASAPFRLIHSTLYNDVGLPNTDNSMVYINQVDLFMINSIVWSTTSLEGLDHPAGTNTVYYVYNSIWSGSQTTNGTNHYRNENPYFEKNTLRVSNYSNAIGKGSASVIDDPNGSNYSLPTIDYFGTTRPFPSGTNPDIGAYEDSLGTPFIDTTAPTVTLSPANGAAAISVNSNITIIFNEAVRNIDDSNLSDTNVDGLITLKENNDSGADISFDATINDGKTIITINPVNDFTSGQVVYVSIGATIEDYSDNATAAASAIFSTIDNVAPAIIITPSDGATGVAIDANITIAFSEPIRKTDDADLTDTNVDAMITLKDTNSDGADISFDATVNTEKTAITINPTNNFSKGQIVYVRIDALVEDSFDNAVSVTNSIFTVVKNQRPIAGKIRDGLLAEDIDLFTSTTSISANWDAFVDDGTSITYEYAIGKNLTSLNTVADWTSTGTDTFMTKTGLTIEANVFYYVSVRGTDAESLVSDTVTTDGQVNTVDTEVPTVTSVAVYASEEASTEMSWSVMTDSLTVRAVATDNIGVAYFKFAVGSGQEKNNVADWTEPKDSEYSFTGLTFTDGSTYQTWAKAYDASDNVSVEVGSNTFQIDASGPMMGIVNDGGSEDVDLIETSTDFSLSWAGFDDGTGIGIESYEFSIGTIKGGTDILNFVNAGLVNTYSVSSLNLVHGELYYSSVKAVDKLGNWSALASSDGFTLDEFPGPASIVSVSPAVDTNLGLISNPKITFQFSEAIQSADVSLTSPLTGTIAHTDIITTNELEVTIDDNLASRDEVTLSLQNVDDLAGVVSEMAEYKFNTSTLADFNDDGTVNAADLSALITAWNAKDYTKELAPTTGTPPNLIPSPDAKYNLRDAMAFTRMWQWSKAGVGSKLLAKVGLEPTISQNGKSLEVLLPANTVAGELQINYPSGQITLEPSDEQADDKILALSYNNADQGRANIAFADREGRSIDKRVISINTRARNAIEMDLIYMFYDKNGLLLGQGTVPFGVTPIPDAFALSYNYPNPFNPITTIEYDLPKDALVKLVIYDMLGRETVSLVNENLPAGYHSITWDAKDRFGNLVSAGIYFYQFQTRDFVKTRKMVLLK